MTQSHGLASGSTPRTHKFWAPEQSAGEGFLPSKNYMASLSSRWKPKNLFSRSPSPSRHKSYPSDCVISPVNQESESATIIAWKNAEDTLRKSLPDKEFSDLITPSRPQDVVHEVEKWQLQQSGSKYAKTCAAVRNGMTRMEKFTGAIDMLAQGSPAPGCLLWGGIKVALTLVKGAVEEYSKLCLALTQMTDCLPRIELYTEAFLNSSLIQDCVNQFYVSMLRFWTRACKFYSRHRLWNFVRVAWNDFDDEFRELQIDMNRCRDQVESAALAEHISESKTARTQQKHVNEKLIAAQANSRQKEILIWLAPSANHIDYYTLDLVTSRRLRHQGTCNWILSKDTFREFLARSPAQESLLWVYGQPGAGKTIVSSFLIDEFQDHQVQEHAHDVLYFFCKNTDIDKNKSTAIIRSLLYQLYKCKTQRYEHETLGHEIGAAIDQSGQPQATAYPILWQLFTTHVKYSPNCVIILDALDECQDPQSLVRGLKSISSESSIKVIVTSRKEPHLYKQLNAGLSLDIGPDDISSDIHAFIIAKVSKSPRLSNPSIRELVVRTLSHGHHGMFLWVYLMLKELKSCYSVAQVQGTLGKLPKGLDGIYSTILARLVQNLRPPKLDLCCKILTLVVTAIRPLKLDELKQAISVLYELEGETLLLKDQNTLHLDKDIELICGSLLAVREGTLQVIHLTVREFLSATDKPRDSPHAELLVDPRQASMMLTRTCLKCIENYCAHPIMDVKDEIARIDFQILPSMTESLRNERPLAEYASFSWLTHLTDCAPTQTQAIAKIIWQTFSSEATFNWCELCMALQPDSVDRLLIGLDELNDWILASKPDYWSEQDATCQFFDAWCVALKDLFEDFGPVLSKRPWEIHYLDLRMIFQSLEGFYQRYGHASDRDVNVTLRDSKPKLHLRPFQSGSRFQLHESVQSAAFSSHEIFFLHDEERDLYFWGPLDARLPYISLNVQHSRTGQHLPPSTGIVGANNQDCSVNSCAMSSDGQFIALVYKVFSIGGANPNPESDDSSYRGPLTVIWKVNKSLDFTRRMNSQPWARLEYSQLADSNLEPTSKGTVFVDGYCFTPNGRISLKDGDILAFMIDPVEQFEDEATRAHDYSFDGNGNMYLSENFFEWNDMNRWQARMFSPISLNAPNLYSWDEPTWRMFGVSTYGRYLVIGDVGGLEASIHLFDTVTREVDDLVCPCSNNLFGGLNKVHFCQNERKLIAFFQCEKAGISTLIVVIWNDLLESKNYSGYGELPMEAAIWHPLHYFVHRHGNSALIVSSKKSIQTVELGGEVLFPDASIIENEYSCNTSKVSHDGRRVALLSYGPRKGRVQISQLDSAAPPRQIQLSWLECENPKLLIVAWSPDLSMLIVDAEVFDLSSLNDDMMSDPFMIQDLTEWLPSHREEARSSYYGSLRCQISSCKSFVIFEGRGNPMDFKTYPCVLLVFRIDLSLRLSKQLLVELPDGLSFMSAHTHPSLPLVAMCFAAATEAEMHDWDSEPPQLHLRILDLETLQVEVIVVPDQTPKYVRRAYKESLILPAISFSTCGTFASIVQYSTSFRRESWHYIIHRLNISPVSSRVIENRSFGEGLWSSEYRVQLVDSDSNSIALKMTRPFQGESWSPLHEPAARLRNFVLHPSHLRNTRQYLLLGDDDNTKMRLLFVPQDGSTPEIHPLSLTFAEALARLEVEWESLVKIRKEREVTNADRRIEMPTEV